MEERERNVKRAVYAACRASGAPPSAGELAARLGLPRAEILDAFRSLAAARYLVLDAGSGEIWMAHPFAAIETDFVVHTHGRRVFANCVWDGLAILSIFGDGTLDTHSPASGEPLRYEVESGVVSGEGIVHFLVPARQFWDDIGYT